MFFLNTGWPIIFLHPQCFRRYKELRSYWFSIQVKSHCGYFICRLLWDNLETIYYSIVGIFQLWTEKKNYKNNKKWTNPRVQSNRAKYYFWYSSYTGCPTEIATRNESNISLGVPSQGMWHPSIAQTTFGKLYFSSTDLLFSSCSARVGMWITSFLRVLSAPTNLCIYLCALAVHMFAQTPSTRWKCPPPRISNAEQTVSNGVRRWYPWWTSLRTRWGANIFAKWTTWSLSNRYLILNSLSGISKRLPRTRCCTGALSGIWIFKSSCMLIISLICRILFIASIPLFQID